MASAKSAMVLALDENQLAVLDKLESGSILCGGVGSGKSRTSLAYFIERECQGKAKINGASYAPMQNPKDLYIITTAKKRDELDWQEECAEFNLYSDPTISVDGVKVTVDSWNNIMKYKDVSKAFFIFDEQRLVGSGAWVKAFYKITKPKQQNHWLLCTATPGDKWLDYIPVFVANGFYRNKTDFKAQHVVYNSMAKYPKIDHYVGEGRLLKLRQQIVIHMKYNKHTVSHEIPIEVDYDKDAFKRVFKDRWDIFNDCPIKNASSWGYLMRRVCNSALSRIAATADVMEKYPKLIIFYNFDYELDILRELCEDMNTPCSEWNGHKHENIPETDNWVYLVQYFAGAEGWECISTNAILFYSQSYSYKTMVQAAGRIDRRNTPFVDLYYIHLRSKSYIDKGMLECYKAKENFNIETFWENPSSH